MFLLWPRLWEPVHLLTCPASPEYLNALCTCSEPPGSIDRLAARTRHRALFKRSRAAIVLCPTRAQPLWFEAVAQQLRVPHAVLRALVETRDRLARRGPLCAKVVLEQPAAEDGVHR